MTADRSVTPRTTARAPAWAPGLAGMLMLVGVIEYALASMELRLEPLAAADWGLNRAEAVGEAAGADILCLGDSLIKCGVSPGVLASRLGLTAYNLASLGAAPPASYFLFKRALVAGARPRAIVLDACAGTLTAADYRGIVRNWSALIGPRDALRLARDEGDLGFFGIHLIYYLVPSVRMRLDLRQALADELAGKVRMMEQAPGPIAERQHAINRGAFHRPRSHAKEGPDLYPGGVLPPNDEVVCYPKGWTPYPTNLVYLHKILALAESRGVLVFYLVPPIHPGVQAGREARGLDEAYVALVRKIHARYANVIVVDGRHSGFAHGAFADALHLDTEGAAALSAGLAEAMAPRLEGHAGGDRWVSLPRYSDPADLSQLEDTAGSTIALARQAARR